MKYALALFSILCFSKSYAQKAVTIYYNSMWEITFPDSSYSFYRECTVDTLTGSFIGPVKDFDATGNLIMTGSYSNATETGEHAYYYSNGQTEMIGKYTSGQRSGTWKYFYPNGKPLQEIFFDDNGGVKIFYMYDSLGNKILEQGTGKWYSIYEEYEVPGKIILQGNFVNHQQNGEWICQLSDGRVIYKQQFKKGKIIESYFTNPDGTKAQDYPQGFRNLLIPHYKHDNINHFLFETGVTREHYPYLMKLPMPRKMNGSANEIFLVVEQNAVPQGGMNSFYDFVARNLRYPPEASRNGISGRVFVEFIINKDGSISDVNVIKGIGAGCDEEAIRVVSLSPNWIPGSQRGSPVRQKMVLPIIFHSAKKARK